MSESAKSSGIYCLYRNAVLNTTFWFSDLKHSVNCLKKKQNTVRDKNWRNCFHLWSSIQILRDHKLGWYKNEAPTIILLNGQIEFQSKSTKTTLFIQSFLHLHISVFLVPIPTCATTSEISS